MWVVVFVSHLSLEEDANKQLEAALLIAIMSLQKLRDVTQALLGSILGRWRAGRPCTAPGRRGWTLYRTCPSSSPCGPAPPTPIQVLCGLCKVLARHIPEQLGGLEARPHTALVPHLATSGQHLRGPAGSGKGASVASAADLSLVKSESKECAPGFCECDCLLQEPS